MRSTWHDGARTFKGLDLAAFLYGLIRLLLSLLRCWAYQVGIMAKPEEVVTGSRLSGITEGIMGHDPVAMASTAGGVVGL